MVRIFVGADGKHKLLRTDAQTIEELFAAVERRLGVRIAKLELDEADIEDDEDVLALNTDDKLQVEVLPSEEEPLDGTNFADAFADEVEQPLDGTDFSDALADEVEQEDEEADRHGDFDLPQQGTRNSLPGIVLSRGRGTTPLSRDPTDIWTDEPVFRLIQAYSTDPEFITRSNGRINLCFLAIRMVSACRNRIIGNPITEEERAQLVEPVKANAISYALVKQWSEKKRETFIFVVSEAKAGRVRSGRF